MVSVLPDPLPTREHSAWACSPPSEKGTAQQTSSSDLVAQNLEKGRGREIQEVWEVGLRGESSSVWFGKNKFRAAVVHEQRG